MKQIFRKKQKPQELPRRRSSVDNPAVFSYYARGSSDSSQNTGRNEPDQNKKTGSYQRLIYLPSYIALGLVLIAGIYSCWLQPSPKIVVLSQDGTVARTNQDYQNGIVSIWNHSILNQTKLTVHSGIIKNEILSQYSELAKVQIDLPLLGRRPTVILTPARPALQYISTNGVFYVNASGKVMARVTELTQNHLIDLPLVRDETNIQAETGKNVVPESEASFLQALAAQLAQDGIKAESITLPGTAANEADVRLLGQAYLIKFSTLGDPRQALGAYLTVKSKLEAEHALPKEYIDVRVEEKVFYK